MKFAKNKTIATIFALFLILTITDTLIALPLANAHTPPWQIQSWVYAVAAPNPVGLGQNVYVVFWADQVPWTASGPWGDSFTFTLKMTKPDGTTKDLGPFISDPVGGSYYLFQPDQVGNYSFVATMLTHTYTGLPIQPGYTINNITGAAYVNDTYIGSSSAPSYLTVQQEPLTEIPNAALPTEYWSRPIDAGLRGWNAIGGNWLSDGRGNQGTTGPETAHIVWTKSIAPGGIVGLQDPVYGQTSYYTGSSYEGAWVEMSEGGSRTGRPAVNYWFDNAVIMNGKLYYNVPLSDARTPSTVDKFVCVDLRTGEQLWQVNGTRLNFGILYDYESPNQHGVLSYLWADTQNTVLFGAGTVKIYDPFSGTEEFIINNVPARSPSNFVVGPWGEPLIYTLNSAGWLTCWNMTAIPTLLAGTSGSVQWQWRPIGKTVDGRTGYQWNVTVPQNMGTIQYALPDRLIGYGGLGLSSQYDSSNYTLWAISTKPGQEGQIMWQKNFTYPPSGPGTTDRPGPWSLEDGVLTMNNKNTRTWYGYSLDTGEKLWGPTAPQGEYDMYYSGNLGKIAYGKLYSASYSGIVYCYDVKNGNLLWSTPLASVGLEGPYVNWPAGTGSGGTLADGKFYITTSEHSHDHPLYRGWRIYCLNATTGEHIWNITSLGVGPSIADGYLVSLNLMNYQIHVYGKGPTDTTVSASPKVSTVGNKVLVEGSVNDISAGTMSPELKARFPDGVPAISDKDMTPWMEYVYHQHEKPNNAVGVEVVVSVLDPNNNNYEVGRTTSDANGLFKMAFTPQVPGAYTVIATFQSSKSYWPSSAETAIVVDETAPTPTTQPVAAMPPTEMYIVAGVIAIIIAIAIGFAITILTLRKRP